MAHAQKPDFVFKRNGRVHLNRRGRQFSRLLAAEVCASAVVMVVMLDTPCSEVVWRVLATYSIRQFPLHFPSLRHRVQSHFNWTLQCRTVSIPQARPDRTEITEVLWKLLARRPRECRSGHNTVLTGWGVSGFPQHFQINFDIILRVGLRWCSSVGFAVYYYLITLPFAL